MAHSSRATAQPAHAAARPGDATLAPPEVHNALRSFGRPLERKTRATMERRFGHDFGHVRVHADAAAAESARSIGALAYSVGGHVVFGASTYRPDTATGRRVIAHELAHVAQQPTVTAVPASGRPLAIGGAADPAEREADAAVRAIAGARRPCITTRPGAVVRRLGDPSARPATLSCPLPASSPAGVVASHPFVRDSAALAPADVSALEAFAASWHAALVPDSVRIDGYASEEGGQTHNWELSCDRAQSVASVLMAPRIGTGIPTARISVFAHGASTNLGATREANRVATVSLPVRAAPAPAPAAPPPAPPAFVCGPDVSQEVRDAVAKTRTTFAGWSVADRTSACDSLDSLSTGGFAWDIVDLHNNAWILGYRPACATAGASPPCGSTVEIDGECSYAGSPNYVIFGVMCSLCNGHFTLVGPSTRAADFSQAAMLRLIDLYKGTGFTGLGTPAGNFGPSNDWAQAGYRGWPGVSSPAGDRPGCAPACATPYAGAPFRVHWWPHGVF